MEALTLSFRGRRDSLEILLTILEILLTHREVSKTKLMNQANLNPYSFERYTSLLEAGGFIVKRRERSGRTVYSPTPRARTLYNALRVITAALTPPPRVLERYRRGLAYLREWAKSRGCRVEEPPGPKPCYADVVVVCDGVERPAAILVDGDPLAHLKEMFMHVCGGSESLIVRVSDGQVRVAEGAEARVAAGAVIARRAGLGD